MARIRAFENAAEIASQGGVSAFGKAAIEVRDDGVGFDPNQSRTAANGLLGMRFRVEAEGGALRVRSAPGQGASVSATLPLLEPDATI